MTGPGLAPPEHGAPPLRLHIGGLEARPGWTLIDIQPGPGVDVVGDCTDLSRFADGSAAEIYASHVLEHLGFREQLPRALAECHRVLAPDGVLRIGVPDMEAVCRLALDPRLDLGQRLFLMTHLFGGQTTPHDFHRVGLTYDFLKYFVAQAGFRTIARVSSFGLFADSTELERFGVRLSLNVEVRK